MLYQPRKCKLKNEKFTDVCMTGVSTYIFSADVTTPYTLKLCRVTKLKVLFLFLVSVFHSNPLPPFLEKGLLYLGRR